MVATAHGLQQPGVICWSNDERFAVRARPLEGAERLNVYPHLPSFLVSPWTENAVDLRRSHIHPFSRPWPLMADFEKLERWLTGMMRKTYNWQPVNPLGDLFAVCEDEPERLFVKIREVKATTRTSGNVVNRLTIFSIRKDSGVVEVFPISSFSKEGREALAGIVIAVPDRREVHCSAIIEDIAHGEVLVASGRMIGKLQHLDAGVTCQKNLLRDVIQDDRKNRQPFPDARDRRRCPGNPGGLAEAIFPLGDEILIENVSHLPARIFLRSIPKDLLERRRTIGRIAEEHRGKRTSPFDPLRKLSSKFFGYEYCATVAPLQNIIDRDLWNGIEFERIAFPVLSGSRDDITQARFAELSIRLAQTSERSIGVRLFYALHDTTPFLLNVNRCQSSDVNFLTSKY